MKQELVVKLLEMLLDGGDSVPEDKRQPEWSHPLKGKPVIIRARDAGVHFGYLEHFEGRVVTLSKSRRMYRWWAKTQMTLSAVAEFGLNLEKDLKIQNELPFHVINDACEIIPCTQASVDSFSKVVPHNEQ